MCKEFIMKWGWLLIQLRKHYLWCDLCHIRSMDGERSEVHVKDNLGLCLDQRRKQEDCVLPHPLAGVVIEERARTVVVTFPPMSMCWENHNAIAFWHGIGVWHTGDTNQTWKESYLSLKNEHMENNIHSSTRLEIHDTPYDLACKITEMNSFPLSYLSKVGMIEKFVETHRIIGPQNGKRPEMLFF